MLGLWTKRTHLLEVILGRWPFLGPLPLHCGFVYWPIQGLSAQFQPERGWRREEEEEEEEEGMEGMERAPALVRRRVVVKTIEGRKCMVEWVFAFGEGGGERGPMNRDGVIS